MSLYRSLSKWNLLTLNAKGGIARRGRGWNVNKDSESITGEHGRTEPTIEALDDPARVLGNGPNETFELTPTDIMTANLLCNRNFHVNAVHPDGNMSDERLEIDFARGGFPTVLPYRAGRSRLNLFGNPGTSVSARIIMADGRRSPPEFAVSSTGLERWRSLAMAGTRNRPLLYALNSRGGDVVRFRMSQTPGFQRRRQPLS